MFLRNNPILILFLICTVSCQWTSLTFVVDDSLSMKDDVDDVRNAVNTIMDIFIQEQMQIGNIRLVTFNDREPKLRTNTDSPEDLMASLTSIRPANDDYNYECAENVLSGVQLALESSLPEFYIFVFTDASAKDYRKIRKIQRLCQEKQSQVVFVLTGDCNRPYSNRFQVYYDIATASSGLALKIERNEMKAIYPAIRETLKYTKVVLNTATLAGNDTEVPFQTNERIEYVIVSASGINVSLEISGPLNQSVEMEKIMWTDHGKVVKLKNPSLGEYVVTAKSTNSTSVVVAGWTNFYFYYGFSKQEVTLLEDTEPKPFSGTATHLSLFVTDHKYSLEEPSAQILDIKGNVTKQFPLKEIRPNFYITTKTFTAPIDLFKIAILGKVAGTGKPIRRIVETPIKPDTIAGHDVHHHVYLLEDQSITLNCSLPRMDTTSIKWLINHEDIGVDESYLDVNNAKVSDDGNYTCHLSDVFGSATETFEVNVGYPPRFKYPQSDPVVNWSGDKEDVLRCDVDAKPSQNVKWTFNEKPLADKSEQLSISKEGHYRCNVTNVHGAVQRDFDVILLDSSK